MSLFISTSKQGITHFAVIIFYSLLLLSCKQTKNADSSQKKEVIDSPENKSAIAATKPGINIPPLSAIPDSGKPFFKVAVYKNNEPFAQYEGDWAIALQSGKNMSIQFPGSKRMLQISHGLIFYFNSPALGSFQVAPSGNEKEKPVVIFTPEIDGAYGIGVTATSGQVTLTSYSDKQISGNIEASGKDEKGNTIYIQAAFINIKNNIAN